MKKKKTKPAKSAKKFPRRTVMIITAIAVVAIAAITVVSRQSANGKQVNTPQLAKATTEKYTKVRVGGQDVFVDQTGKMKPLTAEEAKKLADGLKGMLNKSTEGLVEEKNADGSVSVDLQDRFQNVTVARVNEDGSLSTSCVDNPKAAANFFGIDQKLLEPDQRTKGGHPTPVN